MTRLIYIAGLRKVYPYYFNFTTFAKPTWVGRTLLDVYTTEFGTESPDNYVSRENDSMFKFFSLLEMT